MKMPIEAILSRKWIKTHGHTHWSTDCHLSGFSEAVNMYYNEVSLSRDRDTGKISYRILGNEHGEVGDTGELGHGMTIPLAKKIVMSMIEDMYAKGNFALYM